MVDIFFRTDSNGEAPGWSRIVGLEYEILERKFIIECTQCVPRLLIRAWMVSHDEFGTEVNMRRRVALLGTSAFVVILLSFAISMARPATAGRPADGATDTPTPAASRDDLQRSYRTDHYLEVAESGVDRGENIYWHKCWACHNKYQQAAPTLEGLFKQPALITGVPVNEENVAAHIKKGGPGMPSFRHHALRFGCGGRGQLFAQRQVLRRGRTPSGQSVVSIGNK